MTDSMPSSWRDSRYLAAVVGVVALGALLFYAGLTDGPPTAESVAAVAVVLGLGAWLVQNLRHRL